MDEPFCLLSELQHDLLVTVLQYLDGAGLSAFSCVRTAYRDMMTMNR